MRYSHVLGAVASMPWAIQKDKLLAIFEVVTNRVAIGNGLDSQAVDAAITPQQATAIRKSEGGVMVIPVFGVISQRMDMFMEFSGGTSTERLAQQIRHAIADPDVKAIVLNIDSPGGSVYGTPEIAQTILNSRGTKPIIAQVNSLTASAAYWIASAADDIAMTPSGEVGSIGVYTMHEDISQWLEANGLKEKFIYAGDYKVEGNPFEPLSEEAEAYIQSRVDDYYGMFVDAVAKGRGVTSKKVLSDFGQGRVFGAKQALAAGMIDRIATLDETLARYGVQVAPKPRGRSIEHRERELALAEKT